MRKKLLVVFCLIALLMKFVFAQNIIIGTWNAEIIGMKDTITITFDENGDYSMSKNEVFGIGKYQFDGSSLVLSSLNPPLILTAEINENEIKLRFTQGNDSPLMEGLRQQFSPMRGINKITDDYIDILLNSFSNVLPTIVFIRLFK